MAALHYTFVMLNYSHVDYRAPVSDAEFSLIFQSLSLVNFDPTRVPLYLAVS